VARPKIHAVPGCEKAGRGRQKFPPSILPGVRRFFAGQHGISPIPVNFLADCHKKNIYNSIAALNFRENVL
jgi:hypothetical protein